MKLKHLIPTFILIYLIGSIASTNFNPLYWITGVKVFCIILMIGTWIIHLIIMDDKNQI